MLSDLQRALLDNELIRDEGCRLSAYRDTNGFWTIGVGHLLGSGMLPRMTSITLDEAYGLLAMDVATAEAALVPIFGQWNNGAAYGAVRYRAMVNMAFNRGQKHMQESTTITPAILKAMADGNWSPVTVAIAASPWAKQIGARATRIAYMLEHGEVMP